MFCPQCGYESNVEASFCQRCGANIRAASSAAEAVATPTPPAVVASSSTAVLPQFSIKQYGGFWIRFLAVLIDGILVALVTFPFSFLLRASIGMAGSAVRMPQMGILVVGLITGLAFSLTVGWLYGAGLESSTRQATLGKMALGLKVTDLTGRRISFARASGRHFAKIISGMTLYVGYIMAGFTDRHQALHDIIAGTLVERA
jgi:uncharacterized RDD family membrane protein YckC